jgi:hypothetical protein
MIPSLLYVIAEQPMDAVLHLLTQRGWSRNACPQRDGLEPSARYPLIRIFAEEPCGVWTIARNGRRRIVPRCVDLLSKC